MNSENHKTWATWHHCKRHSSRLLSCEHSLLTDHKGIISLSSAVPCSLGTEREPQTHTNTYIEWLFVPLIGTQELLCISRWWNTSETTQISLEKQVLTVRDQKQHKIAINYQNVQNGKECGEDGKLSGCTKRQKGSPWKKDNQFSQEPHGLVTWSGPQDQAGTWVCVPPSLAVTRWFFAITS